MEKWRRVLAVLVVLAGACAESTSPLSSTASLPAVSSTTITAAPATTAMPELSTTTSAVPVPEQWLAVYRRDFPGYAVELTELGSGRKIILPTDRTMPYPQAVFGDGAGGIVTGAPLTHLRAGAHHAEVLGPEGALVEAVIDIDGTPAVLYRTVEGESGWDGWIFWNDLSIDLIARPLDGEPATVLSTHSSSRVDYPTGTGEQDGHWLETASFGGDVLALVWTRIGDCSRLELRSGLSSDPAQAVNPRPGDVCVEGFSGGLLEVAVTGDGSHLVGLVYPPLDPSAGGQDLVAWSLTTGEEVGRVPGVLYFSHDGNRSFALTRSTERYDENEVAIAHLSADGFDVAAFPEFDSGIVGLISGSLHLADGASLTPADPWTSCSAAGSSPELPDDDELPAPVATARRSIAEAAASCDLVRLAEVAIASDAFRMADGDTVCGEPWMMSMEDDDAVSYWYRGDTEFGEMDVILETLAVPAVRDGDRFVWTGEHGYRIEIDAAGFWLLDWRTFPRPPCETIDCTC